MLEKKTGQDSNDSSPMAKMLKKQTYWTWIYPLNKFVMFELQMSPTGEDEG